MSGILYLVATPIGNLEDITFRAIKILEEVDLIAAEDTRQTLKLLNHYKINKPLISYHRHNEDIKVDGLIKDLKEGKNIALVSDAGTPVISDPGEVIVKNAIKENIKIIPIPGACALINALITSGLATREFSFYGFLPINKKLRKDKLEEIKKENNSIIEQIDKYNREVSNIKYKIDYLEEEINNNSRMPLSIKSILNNPIFKGIHNTIANLITVSNEYSLALMTSLTSSSNYLVVDSKAVASRLVTYLKENKLGRATFYPLDTMKPRNVYEEDLIKIKDNTSFIGILNNLVEYDPIYTNVISNLIGNVLVVKDIDSANEISKILNNKYKIVTLDGQVVNVGGSITGGDKIKTNDTIEARHNLEEYKNKLNITLDNIKEKETILQKSNKELNDIVSKLTQLKINVDSIKEIIKKKLE